MRARAKNFNARRREQQKSRKASNVKTQVAPCASDGLPPLRTIIETYGLWPKKSLGQHFLLDLNLTRKIARASGPLENTVLYEVGPGPGGLTRALLAQGAKTVVAVETDERCLPALEQIAHAYPQRLHVVIKDALKIEETDLVPAGARIAANLPYNLGTQLLVKWLAPKDWPPFWASLTLMFQKEVARRIVAQSGSEFFGRLSVLAQWRCRAKILFDVHPKAFVPSPNVVSSVLRLEPRSAPLAPAPLAALEKITAASFGQRRKMLRQSLKQVVEDPQPLIEACGLDPSLRPEELKIEDFAALARALDT